MPLSTFLKDRPMSTLRGAQMLAFNDTATVQTRTITSDSGGGATDTWNTSATTVCRIYPVTNRPKSGTTGGAVDERTTHFCEMPQGITVSADDRIVVTSLGTFEVTFESQRSDALTTVVEVIQIS